MRASHVAPGLALLCLGCGLLIDRAEPAADRLDAGVADAGLADAGGHDAGSDGGPRDAGDRDAGETDAGSRDAGSGSDAGSCDEPLLRCDGACVDIRADIDHCGACSRACFDDEHGRLGCVVGECRVLDCGDNRGDCNLDASDGCEQLLATAEHCGSCGARCPAGQTCVAGTCASP